MKILAGVIMVIGGVVGMITAKVTVRSEVVTGEHVRWASGVIFLLGWYVLITGIRDARAKRAGESADQKPKR